MISEFLIHLKKLIIIEYNLYRTKNELKTTLELLSPSCDKL